MPKILITDSLFIDQEDEARLRAGGYEITRLDNPKATEDELIAALQDADGYILGGIESVTDKVIASTKKLRAISFTGAGYADFIPGHQLATQKGIAISNTPGGPSYAVAEFMMATILMQLRQLLKFGAGGKSSFGSAASLANSKIGIVGFGHIGQTLAKMLSGFSPAGIFYYNRTSRPEAEAVTGAKFLPLLDLAATCNVIAVCIDTKAGSPLLTAPIIHKMQPGSILVNISTNALIDAAALKSRVEKGEIFVASDHEFSGWNNMPYYSCYTTNASTAFNTTPSIRKVSAMATDSILNLLKTGQDRFLVNPEYQKFKKSA